MLREQRMERSIRPLFGALLKMERDTRPFERLAFIAQRQGR